MSKPDLTPFLDTRQNQLQLEMAAADAIDTKALAVLASDFAILLFIVQSNNLNLHAFGTTIVFLLLSMALFISCIAIWPRKYAGASASIFDSPSYATLATGHLIAQLIIDTEAAIIRNGAINHKRWVWCSCALVLTLAASLVLFIMLYLQ